jgi:putative oxidoreductase
MATLIGLLEAGRRLAERIPYSIVALVARFAVASVFWRSGQTKVEGFAIKDNTFFLFREEYKVPLLPPDLAAYMATVAEHVFPCCSWSDLPRGCPRSASSL